MTRRRLDKEASHVVGWSMYPLLLLPAALVILAVLTMIAKVVLA